MNTHPEQASYTALGRVHSESVLPAQVPFTALGHLQGYVGPQGCDDWRDNTPFHAALELTEVRRGVSSARFIWVDPATNITYPMLLADTADLISNSVLDRGTVTGWWVVGLRGKNYGLRRAPAELTPDNPTSSQESAG
ncbi:hypothetical protein [Streptomyces sp. cg35]|uniref:hypothetical protein n=1 Tax=Streptomyces sp. cg35 TaxID=3421650 RepID=UPI003D17E1CE